MLFVPVFTSFVAVGVHLLLSTSTHHENVFPIFFIKVVGVLFGLLLIESHACGLGLTAEHCRFHVSLFLPGLGFHLLEEVFTVGLLEDGAGLLLFFVGLEENSAENFCCNSLMKAVRHQLGELIKLFLLILRMLRLLDKPNDFLLNLLG